MKKEADSIFRVYHDSDLNAVVMEWTGYFTTEQFKSGSEVMLAELRKQKAKKVLALIRDMVLIGMEEQKWLLSGFLPRAIENGFRVCAILTPRNYFNKVAIENINCSIDSRQLLVNSFESEQEAKQWLKSFDF